MAERLRLIRSFSWRDRNRLTFRADWYDEHTAGVVLAYGYTGGDQMWTLGLEMTNPPEPIAKVIGWLSVWQDRRERRRLAHAR